MTEHDYSRFNNKSNLDTVLIQLSEELLTLLADREYMQQKIDELDVQIKRYQEQLIPDVAEGVEGKLQLSDGTVITIKEDIRINASRDKKPGIVKWLTDIGSDSIVRRQLVCEFDKGEGDKFNAIRQAIAATDSTVPMKSTVDVHHMTLKALVKEMLENGEEVPIDVLGLFRQRIAKVER